jgi:hypothetical protein
LNIGITGHQQRDGADWAWARLALANYLSSQENVPLIGWSSLAAGADQLFAQEVLELGGCLTAVIPLSSYDECFETDNDLLEYRRLLNQSARVIQLENRDPQSGFFAASKLIVQNCETLIAIWDEEPSHGRGGTADVVHFALSEGREVKIFNPVLKMQK